MAKVRLLPRRTNLQDAERTLTMFLILEGVSSAQATEIGPRYSTRKEATAAVRNHLKKFKASERNPEGIAADF